MRSLRITSDGPFSRPLSGRVAVAGAKNSALKLMAATLLAPGRSMVHNVPHILDVAVMGQLLEHLGCNVEASFSQMGSGSVTVEVPEELGWDAPYEIVRRLRASINVLGPLVARCGRASVALPGGDAIGSRGLDMHIAGLERLGARVWIEHGQVVADVAGRYAGAAIALDFPSMGATENLLTAAVLAEGTTVIDNAAREPEIVDLCRMLSTMGAEIEGVSTSTLTITGVDSLRPVEHTTVADRIVSGTWAFAPAIAGGAVTVGGGVAGHLDLVLDKLVGAGAKVSSAPDGFTVTVTDRLRAFDVVTLPYPGFPTDLQPFAMALASVSDGSAMITENVFESRFMFAQELARLGADLHTDGHHAVVRGRKELSGAPVVAHDIRAGAALALAGLGAQGTTTVGEAQHIDRGYPYFAESLRAVGADIERIEGS
ncbi:MAG: UDP-N-acetylglucosamine 1-carboxyvinyltransferase [Actinomycetota bacterium]|nr:UDP-N-acetylglucosamine 1-carboxyvinyltransferase [Actinomycetota bacterium]